MQQDDRFKITPQMHDYERIAFVEWQPYTMFCNRINFESEVCHTDEYGFRWTYDKQKQHVTREKFLSYDGRKGIVVGGSTIFGTGATHDRFTLPSQLNSISETTWFNFGGRAFNSTQEWIQSQLHFELLQSVDELAICSGINTIFLMFAAEASYDEILGWHFYQSFFQEAFQMLDKPVESSLLGLITTKLIEALTEWKEQQAGAAEGAEGILRGGQLTANDGGGYANMLKITKRDLSVWKSLQKSLGFQLTFILQPVATWIQREPTEQEKKLFEILDDQPGNLWIPKAEFWSTDMHQQYSADLRHICNQLDIPFFDSNSNFQESEWYFVDRVHLTDLGYRKLAEYFVRNGITR